MYYRIVETVNRPLDLSRHEHITGQLRNWRAYKYWTPYPGELCKSLEAKCANLCGARGHFSAAAFAFGKGR